MNVPFVLMVDDDEDDRMIFKHALSKADPGLGFCEAESADSALRFLDADGNNIPTLIFLDLNMPGRNGWQCLLEIRSRKRFSHVPIVVFSTSEDSRVNKNPAAAINVYFMTKQPRMSNLIACLKHALSGNWAAIGLLNKEAYAG